MQAPPFSPLSLLSTHSKSDGSDDESTTENEDSMTIPVNVDPQQQSMIEQYETEGELHNI